MTKPRGRIGTIALICGFAVIASFARDEGGMSDLDGAAAWLNSPPLSTKALRGDANYGTLATFSEQDGNGWLLQKVTARLPGRIELAGTAFASVTDLASALRRAETAHSQHERRTGQRDANWPDWYAAYIVAEQAGKELPQ